MCWDLPSGANSDPLSRGAHVRSFLASTLNSAAATSIGAPIKHSLTALHRNAKGGWAAATEVTAVHPPMGPGRLA